MININFRSRRKPETPRGLFFFFLVWTVFVLIFGVAAFETAAHRPSRDAYPPVQASVTGSTIRREKSKFWLELAVQFKWDGGAAANVEGPERDPTVHAVTQSLEKDAGAVSGDYSDVARARDSKFTPGTPVALFVNPQSPGEVFLSNANPYLPLWAQFCMLSPFLLIGIFGLRAAIRGMRSGSAVVGNLPPRAEGAIKWVVLTVFLAVGLLLGWKMDVVVVSKWLAARHWPQVPCTIVESWIVVSDKGTSRVGVLYEYAWAGKNFRSDQWSLIDGSDNVTDKHATQATVRPGAARTCFVDPADPYTALLDRNLGWWGLMLLFPLPFIAIGGLGLGSVLLSFVPVGLRIRQPKPAGMLHPGSAGRRSRSR